MKLELIPTGSLREAFTLLIDGHPQERIHISIFGRHPKFPEEIHSLEEWQAEFDAMEYRLAKNYVLKRLSAQNYYSRQLEKRLIERYVKKQTAQKLIQEAISWGYLNDEAWLDAFMRGHVKRHGARSISQKLQIKGVPLDVIEETMEKWRDPEEDKEAIRRFVQTRFRSRNLSNPKERQKVIAALIRRGYSFEQVYSILKEYSSLCN